MNKNKVALLSLSLCGAFLVVVILFLLGPKGRVQEGLGVNNRIIKNDILKICNIKELNVDVYTPIAAFGEQLYMYASSAGHIVVLDSSLSIQQTVGKYGPGPGETDFLNDIVVNEQGIHLIDRQGKILIINHFNKVINEFKIDQTPIRAIKIAQDKWFIKSSALGTNTEEEFKIYSTTGNVRVLFQRQTPEDDADIRDEQVDGEFIRNNDGKFFRISQFCGQFLCFDSSGIMLYNVRTVDETPIPQYRKSMSSDGDLQVFRAEGSRMINPSATADKQYLYILSNAASPNIKDNKFGRLKQLVVDVYEASSGRYVCSFMAPNYKETIPKIIYRYSKGMLFVYDYNTLLYAEIDANKFIQQQ